MFIRSERSIKEFMRLYPIISGLVIIYLSLWFIIDFLHLPIGQTIYNQGVGSNYLIAQGEYWRLITPMFLHSGLTHMLFNSFSLVLFGPALEQMLGRFKFILTYLGAGVVGNLGTFFLGSNDLFYLHVGASGAIYGLFGVYIYMVLFRKDLIDSSSAQIVLIIVGIGLVMTFIQPNINISGHIFGFIGGMTLAPLALVNVHPYSPWQTRPRRRHSHNDSVTFDPNRWQKKRLPHHVKQKMIWGGLGILVLIGLLSKMGLF